MKYSAPEEMEKIRNKMMAIKIAPKEVAGEEDDQPKALKTILLKKKLKLAAIPIQELKSEDEEMEIPDDDYSDKEQARIITEQGRIAREKKLRKMIEEM